MAAVTIHSDFRAQEEEICHYFYLFPLYLPWSNGAGCHVLSILIFSCKLAPSLSSFIPVKRLFKSSSLSAIRVVSSTYLRLLRFLPPILFPACYSSSPAFLMMCSAYKLNKQGDSKQALSYSFLNLEPVSCSVQDSNCCFLTSIQVSQETGKMVWYSCLFKFSTVCYYPHSWRL